MLSVSFLRAGCPVTFKQYPPRMVESITANSMDRLVLLNDEAVAVPVWS
ncbi:hypothetical protein CEV34_3200 [Brucella pseudogrignonensis]|uniref:Uncharacterized protein n=1 Tax=Brucella pseudogrignonensis TaxID=419475 RepID=A0A256GAK8_9HYPH|nr:hypothetical protein CEV34_3200 [Brucella pseudogrignonensis]